MKPGTILFDYNRYLDVQSELSKRDEVYPKLELNGRVNNRYRIIYLLGNKCYECDAPDDLTIHHINLKSEGGTNYIDNLAVYCRTCHDAIHEIIPISMKLNNLVSMVI